MISHPTQQVVCLLLLLSDTKACDLKQHGENVIGIGSLEKKSIIGYDLMREEFK